MDTKVTLRPINFELVGHRERAGYRVYDGGEFRGIVLRSPFFKEWAALHGANAAAYDLEGLCALRGPAIFNHRRRKSAVDDLIGAGAPAQLRDAS